MSVARLVAELEAERDALRVEVDRLRQRQADIGRRLYRRGYHAGHNAGRRGAQVVSAPERRARGWVREALS